MLEPGEPPAVEEGDKREQIKFPLSHVDAYEKKALAWMRPCLGLESTSSAKLPIRRPTACDHRVPIFQTLEKYIDSPQNILRRLEMPQSLAEATLSNIVLLQGRNTFFELYAFIPTVDTFHKGSQREKMLTLHFLLSRLDAKRCREVFQFLECGKLPYRVASADFPRFRDVAYRWVLELEKLAGMKAPTKENFLAFHNSNTRMFFCISRYAVRELTKRLHRSLIHTYEAEFHADINADQWFSRFSVTPFGWNSSLVEIESALKQRDSELREQLLCAQAERAMLSKAGKAVTAAFAELPPAPAKVGSEYPHAGEEIIQAFSSLRELKKILDPVSLLRSKDDTATGTRAGGAASPEADSSPPSAFVPVTLAPFDRKSLRSLQEAAVTAPTQILNVHYVCEGLKSRLDQTSRAYPAELKRQIAPAIQELMTVRRRLAAIETSIQERLSRLPVFARQTINGQPQQACLAEFCSHADRLGLSLMDEIFKTNESVLQESHLSSPEWTDDAPAQPELPRKPPLSGPSVGIGETLHLEDVQVNGSPGPAAKPPPRFFFGALSTGARLRSTLSSTEPEILTFAAPSTQREGAYCHLDLKI